MSATGEGSGEQARERVRARYAAAADQAAAGARPSCADGDPTGMCAQAYDPAQLDDTVAAAGAASLGCGNPLAVAELSTGETVLDLGSGGGLDVLLSAHRVGPTGFVYGLDMTEEMLALARDNAAKAGPTNVEFLHGTMEAIPLPDRVIDVVISNCVINLSVDKPAVFAEAHRVLKAGGRIGVSDIIADEHLTPAERAERGNHVDCIAGALTADEYRAGLKQAGFTDITIQPTHGVTDGMHSAIIRAVKPRRPTST